MRNLKRALSLALAAAMLVSLMVVGASAADYGDQAEVTQTEAVDVLTAIGVVGGDQNGNFNPDATLTRAEFCVMIANSLTGGNFDQTLFNGTSTPFTDVAGHWGAGYIAYCYSNGIVAGTSATTFEPDGTLTAAQAAAILLMSLGYNQNNEFAQNGQFSLNVTRWAQQAGLYDGLTVAANSGISRQDTAKLIFNAVVNPAPVGYSSLAESYYTVGTSAVSGVVLSGTQLDPTIGDSSTERTNYTRTLGYTNFDLMKDSTTGKDDFGRPTSVWGVNEDHNNALDDEIATVANAPAATFTAKTNATDVASALRGYSLKNENTDQTYAINNTTAYRLGSNSFSTGHIITTNGDANSDRLIVGGDGVDETVAGAIAAETANGRVIEIYADRDNVVTSAVVVNYTVAEVTNVDDDGDGEADGQPFFGKYLTHLPLPPV